MLTRKLARLFFMGFLLSFLSGCTALGTLNAVLPKDDATREVIRNVAYGELPRQKLDVYVPDKGVEESNLPVVVFIYGGAWNSGDRSEYSFVGHAFNSKGIIAVVPDYRLVPVIRYPAFVLDSARAVEWVANNISGYGGDPSKIFVVGHSAGAYNAMMVGMADALLENNNIELPPLAGLAGLAGPYDFIPLRFPSTKAAFEGTTDLPSTQPVNLVSSDSPALFLVVGLGDQRVSPKHSFELERIAMEQGADAELVSYQDVGHAQLLLSLSRPFRKWSPVLEDLAQFIDRQTRPSAAINQ